MTVLVNGVDLAAYGLIVDSVSGMRDSVDFSNSFEARPGRLDGVPKTLAPNALTRLVRVSGHQLATDNAGLMSTLHGLKANAAPKGELTIKTPNSFQTAYGYFKNMAVTPIQPQYTQRGHQVVLEYECTDTLLYEANNTVVTAITNSDKDVAQGSGPTRRSVIRIDGAATNPVLTYKDSSGATVATLSLTISISGGNWIDIDMKNFTIVDQAAANQISAYTSGEFFALDGRDGNYWSSQWPTLRCSSGTARATYQKAYL